MTEARLVTREQLAAALLSVDAAIEIQTPNAIGMLTGSDNDRARDEYADAIFAALPAAVPAEGPPHRDTRVPPDLSADPEGEHCYDCGQAVGVVWTAPDAMWAEVTDRADGGGLLCVRCFDRRAEQRGQPLRWVPQPLGAAPAEGLREALDAIVLTLAALQGDPQFSLDENVRYALMEVERLARAALARHEPAEEQSNDEVAAEEATWD